MPRSAPKPPETAPPLLPTEPPNEQEAAQLRFLLNMGQSSYNRLEEMGSAYTGLIQTLMEVIDGILSPEDE